MQSSILSPDADMTTMIQSNVDNPLYVNNVLDEVHPPSPDKLTEAITEIMRIREKANRDRITCTFQLSGISWECDADLSLQS